MNILLAYDTMQIDLYSETLEAALISVPGECGTECTNNVIIAYSKMKTIFT